MKTSIRLLALLALALPACKKEPQAEKVGLVTDVGGRGDQSFNDSALRGLEMWVSGKKYTAQGYSPLAPEELAASVPEDLRHSWAKITPYAIQPVVLQAKAQEDYEPNLQLLVDEGCMMVSGIGFMLENAIEAVAKKNPKARFLLVDSPILDAAGKPYALPNVATTTFREQEGSFLVGAIAGMVTKAGKVGFVGGMELPLIKKFESGFKAGYMTTAPGKELLVAYTGSFDDSAAGKRVATDLLDKGADVLFHAAGADGLGVIQAAKEKGKFAIGVDSDQSHVAPMAVLTSMIKHVDFAVYLAVKDVKESRFRGGDTVLGLKEGGVGFAPIRVDIPDKQALLAKVEQLRLDIIAGKIKVPATLEELAAWTPPGGAPPPPADAAAK